MAYVSKERLFLNADKSKVVKEGDPDAAFLLVGEGGTVDKETAEEYGLKNLSAAPEPFDAKAEHELLHAGETEEQAKARRAAMFENKAKSGPPADKALPKAPSNKAEIDATDAARALAEEHGLELGAVSGTGTAGRVTKGDVENALPVENAG